jgi:hypothetical protein
VSTNVEFKVVFEALDRAMADPLDPVASVIVQDVIESSDVRELQRLCAALSAPPARFYTGT